MISVETYENATEEEKGKNYEKKGKNEERKQIREELTGRGRAEECITR